jgi:choline monooxygenase
MGMVFVNLDGSGPEFSTHIAGLEQRWSSFTGVGGLNNVEAVGEDGSLELEFHANWKLAIENYCESYHLPWVHPGLNSYSHIDDHYNIVGGEWGAGQGTYKFTFSERAGIEWPVFDQWPKDKSAQAEYVALFPNVLLGLHIDHFYSVIVQPLAHNRTRELLQIYCVGDSVADDKHARARREMLNGWRAVFEEDIRPLEEMQRGRNSTAFDGGAFSPVLDTATHHFHRWVAARYPHAA